VWEWFFRGFGELANQIDEGKTKHTFMKIRRASWWRMSIISARANQLSTNTNTAFNQESFTYKYDAQSLGTECATKFLAAKSILPPLKIGIRFHHLGNLSTCFCLLLVFDEVPHRERSILEMHDLLLQTHCCSIQQFQPKKCPAQP
jgi:hypothetical protein